LSGIVLTKVDGTAKGGVVLAIWDALRIPLMHIGVGETADDLHAFSAKDFVEALF
jgi:fused signal recognition particle receptor